MPRVGGTFIAPYPPVVPDTTIESEVHNGTVADFVLDANEARPITAGGTGATSAAVARDNLDAAVAAATVTNYGSHVWEPGTFWSNTTATGSPFDGHIFTGACAMAKDDPNHITLEARDQSTGLGYVRVKYAGVWGAWFSEGSDKVAKTGDTMFGNLTINKANPGLVLTKTASGQSIGIFGTTNATSRWAIALGDATPETGSNAGSNFQIGSYSDGGTALPVPFAIERATGALTIGPTRVVGNLVAGGGAAGTLFSTKTGGGTVLGTGFMGRAGSAGTELTNIHNFQWASGLHAWVDTSDLGAVSFTSDYRIKKDVTDLPAQWDAVKALRPVMYTQADYAPLFEADDIERWGFIAHELQETLVPSAASGVKDEPNVIQSPNPWTVIAALTSALQEAMARIEALEQKLK